MFSLFSQNLTALEPVYLFFDSMMLLASYHPPNHLVLFDCLQRTFWIERADFYDQKWMPAVITFDSFEVILLFTRSSLGLLGADNASFLVSETRAWI